METWTTEESKVDGKVGTRSVRVLGYAGGGGCVRIRLGSWGEPEGTACARESLFSRGAACWLQG